MIAAGSRGRHFRRISGHYGHSPPPVLAAATPFRFPLYSSGDGGAGRGRPLHRSELPLGILGRAVHARARVALRGRARLAARHDRPARGHVQPRELRDDAGVAGRTAGGGSPRRSGCRSSRRRAPASSRPGRMCRAVKAAGSPGGAAQERGMLRGVRMAWFTSLLLLDEDEAFAEIASGVPGLDPERLVQRPDGGRASRRPTRPTAPRPDLPPGSATLRSPRTGPRSSTAAPASPRRASSFATTAARSSPAGSSRSRPTTSASPTSRRTFRGATAPSRPSSSPSTRTA